MEDIHREIGRLSECYKHLENEYESWVTTPFYSILHPDFDSLDREEEEEKEGDNTGNEHAKTQENGVNQRRSL